MRKPNYLAQTAPVWVQPLRWTAVSCVAAYYRIACRIRPCGNLPRVRGPALLVANHQNEIESPVIVSDMTFAARFWRYPIFTVSSRRMWEPGFLAERIPWLRGLLRNANLGPLFQAIGMQPIENELRARPFVSIAYALRDEQKKNPGGSGEIPVQDVFHESACARLGANVRYVSDLLRPSNFSIGRTYVSLSEVREPYRESLLADLRVQIEADLTHVETLVRAGATFFLAPESFYSNDGKMQRLRGSLPRLAPLASAWIIGISYDPFAGRRLSMLYRVVEAQPGVPFDVQMKRTRPVTTSALLATWLHGRNEPFALEDAISSVRTQLEALPATLFVDPELQRNIAGHVRSTINGMLNLGILKHHNNRYALTGTHHHPAFSRTDNIILYQSNFHAETLAGASIPGRAHVGRFAMI